jgi:hypothetical protein
MICPSCLSHRCNRSRRRGLKDYTIGLTGLRPWRCMKCEHRFFAAAVPVKFLFTAHCDQCGNFDLQRISKEHVTGWFAAIPRMLSLPAYRCEPCRNRFFSIRPRRKILAIEEEAARKRRPYPSLAESAKARATMETQTESEAKKDVPQAHSVAK